MTPRFCFVLIGSFIVCMPGCGGRPSDSTSPTPPQRRDVTLLTTTSAQDTGLLDVLKPDFEKRTGYELKVISTGTGAALKQAAQGEGDVVLVHDAEAEKEWLAEGNGTSRRLVMYNDFIVVGPASDPAQIKGKPAADAFAAIAKAGAAFVSRGDKSGTHTRELSLWKKAGVEPKGQKWYSEAAAGMGATLGFASDKEQYCLCDRSTFLAHEKRLRLAVLVENDPALLNIYHVMTVNASKFPRVNAVGGQAFANYLVSPETQKLLSGFGKEKFGRALFTPAAGKTEEELQK
jgi:tungstate transport system substrate-binding protein